MSCCVPQHGSTELTLAVWYETTAADGVRTKMNSTHITNGMNNVRVQATIGSDGAYFCELDHDREGSRDVSCSLLFPYSPRSQRETQRGVFSIECAQAEVGPNENVETCEVITYMYL